MKIVKYKEYISEKVNILRVNCILDFFLKINKHSGAPPENKSVDTVRISFPLSVVILSSDTK